jgi:uncharacterized membrane protein
MMWDCGIGTGVWGGWLGMFMMGLFGLMVLLGFVLIVVWLARALGAGPGQGGDQASAAGSANDPAAATARERYARGEISKGELEEILRTLRS